MCIWFFYKHKVGKHACNSPQFYHYLTIDITLLGNYLNTLVAKNFTEESTARYCEAPAPNMHNNWSLTVM
jgi:hypothetical protein